MRILWLADVLREAGLSVVEHSGWKTRGWSDWSPRYGIVHATAAPRTQSDATQVAIVRDGHSTLRGPIANACVDRSGRWHVLASGRCNTAKAGWSGPASGLGNTHVLGVEACNDNRSEPWPKGQYEAYARGWAAICRRMGWPASKVVGHKEHQPGDKSDPTFNMTAFRRQVADLIEEDDMPLGKEDIARVAAATADELLSRRFPRADGKGEIGLMSAAEWGRHHAGGAKTVLREEVLPQLIAAVAAVAGQDTVEAVREELALHRADVEAALEQASTERAEILALVAAVASGERDAADVVDEIARRLATDEA